MQKRLFVLLMLCIVTFLVTAHEFWLQPDRFFFQPGDTLKVNFKVGENFMGESWKVKRDRVIRMELHSATQVVDLKDKVKDDSNRPVGMLLTREGTHIVVMESNQAFIKMDGTTFTEYLQEDGLDEVFLQRKRNQTSGDSASEKYSRHTKLMVQTGSKRDDTFRKVYNLPIEIIPEKNPYELKKGDVIRFKILFQGKPLFGAKVKVWNRYNHSTSVQNIFSQQDGMIETHVSNPGSWMVSVVKMVPSKEAGVDYQSYWGSLVFGIK
jgi:uncharacterized GH25 family protein